LKSLCRFAVVVGALVAVIGSAQMAQAETIDLPISLPGVVVEDVTVIGPSQANVTASIDPNGLATSFFVEYGANNVLSLKTPKVSAGAGLHPGQFVTELLGLEPGSSYSYRVVAESVAGTTAGPVLSFNTPLAGGSGPVVNLATGQPAVEAQSVKKSARCTITGTARSDRLKGTRKKDVICGLGGNDRIRGLGGNDVILGGNGKDRIFGGKGRDRLLGNAGADRLNARDKKRGDRVNGGKGRDKVFVDKGDRVVASESVSRR
jgi:Ca2+-binding RTX toxin-like protein